MNLPSPNFKEKKQENSDDFISFSSTPSTPYGISHTSPNFENNFSQNVQQKYKQNFQNQNHRNNYRGNNYKQNWNNRNSGNNRYQPQQNQNRQRYNSNSNQSPNNKGDVNWSVDAKGENRRSGGGRSNNGNDNRNGGRKGFFHPSMLENPWQKLEDRMDRSKWRTEDSGEENDI